MLKDLELVAIAESAARRAADYIATAARPAPAQWTMKGRQDFVTGVDRAAEALIAETLVAAVPGSAIVGEELSPERSVRGAEVVWIVDPLDGTTNFLHGYPQYAVSIACLSSGALCAAVVHDVARSATYHATRGAGAWVGPSAGGERRPLHVSAMAEPGHALIGTGFPFKRLGQLREYLAQFAAVLGATSGIRRAGAAALDLADLAAGRLDGFWELSLAPWDVAAGVLLVREAGGLVTRLDGSADVIGHGSIVAGNPTVHRWLVDLLRSA